MSGIANPIGVKVGAATPLADLPRLLDTLDRHHEPGRLTLIHRFGASRVSDGLPALIEAVRHTAHPVTWMCDPMHGNTHTTAKGFKTRRFDEIVDELTQSFAIHAALGSHLGGIHIELTGENVTECIGGARGLGEHDLERAYESEVDPRLNYEQALEVALLTSRQLIRSR